MTSLDDFEAQWADAPPPDEPAPPVETTWEPIDLGPYLRGEVTPPEPAIGAYRSDGVQFLYPGREHSILGGTEAGKTWLALLCVTAELNRRNTVVYIHFEESDPASTVERLRLLGVTDHDMAERLHFVAPVKGVRPGWLHRCSTFARPWWFWTALTRQSCCTGRRWTSTAGQRSGNR